MEMTVDNLRRARLRTLNQARLKKTILINNQIRVNLMIQQNKKAAMLKLAKEVEKEAEKEAVEAVKEVEKEVEKEAVEAVKEVEKEAEVEATTDLKLEVKLANECNVTKKVSRFRIISGQLQK
jgi:hypothetical protein